MADKMMRNAVRADDGFPKALRGDSLGNVGVENILGKKVLIKNERIEVGETFTEHVSDIPDGTSYIGVYIGSQYENRVKVRTKISLDGDTTGTYANVKINEFTFPNSRKASFIIPTGLGVESEGYITLDFTNEGIYHSNFSIVIVFYRFAYPYVEGAEELSKQRNFLIAEYKEVEVGAGQTTALATGSRLYFTDINYLYAHVTVRSSHNYQLRHRVERPDGSFHHYIDLLESDTNGITDIYSPMGITGRPAIVNNSSVTQTYDVYLYGIRGGL